MKLATEALDVSMDELEQPLERVREPLGEDDYRKLKAAVNTLGYLTELVADKETTIRQLRQLLLGSASTEKTSAVMERAGIEAGEPSTDAKADGDQKKDAKKPGHGRNGAGAYKGARKVQIAHQSLKRGDQCPQCLKGKVYEQKEPVALVRVVGQAPLAATVYELQSLRCNLCGDVFTADAPEQVGEEKYDETAASMIAQLKYGSGMPFNRQENLEKNLGIPLPASTQWGIVEETAEVIKPALDELIREAAQGEVMHNDDTSMKVLMLEREECDERTGVFTTGIVAKTEEHKIALFFTGRRHAGENLADVLKRRAAGLSAPIQMCDALSRNSPNLGENIEILLANCLAHSRRKFVEVAPNFPAECLHVLESLGEVYGYDAIAREQGMTVGERLQFHKERSDPVMKELQKWLTAQLVEKKTEPNSGLGKAISYLLKHWHKLTLFLRQAGAPLDNNICERALKKAVLHRKNALFYRTLHGAQVGDLFMSLIHTCELNGAGSFDYLTELQRHAGELAANPADWMPWNYRQTMARPSGLA